MRRQAKPAPTSIKRLATRNGRVKKIGDSEEPRRRTVTGRNEPAQAKPDSGGVAAVDRALMILDAFEPADESLTLSQLAQRTSFYKSTILRIAQSLMRY